MVTEISKLKINPFHSSVYKINDIDDLAESIQELGLLQPIIVNSSLSIISGVRRYYALKKLGYTEVDVEIKHLNVAEEIAIISFNKQRVKTQRERLMEAKYLKQLWRRKKGRKSEAEKLQTNSNMGPADTRKDVCKAVGLSAGNFSKLEYIDEVNPDLVDLIDQDNLSINQAHKIAVKLKESKNVEDKSIYLPETISNDYYKIYNKSSDDLSEIPDESVQMIFTSPPYWKLRNYSGSNDELGAEKTPEEYIKRLVDHLKDCYRVLKPEGSFYLNLADTYLDKCLQSIPNRIQIELMKHGWILRNSIIWHKRNSLGFNSKDALKPSYELIFHLVKSKKYVFNEIQMPFKGEVKPGIGWINRKRSDNTSSDYGRVCLTGLKDGKQLEDFWDKDVIHTAVANQAAVKRYGGTEHAAPFPEEICIAPILMTTNSGDTVLDVFSGSGTVGAVALMLGRKFIGYDLDPKHNSVQVGRFNDSIISLDAAIEKYNQTQLSKAA
ncbi:adenine-specific methyltransferase [Aquipluma nitroreducens]|uniref:Methyltransferase n=1 Tax=Aquipluma nitroreducens TaxID=2010828 RepID=A0A5K7SAE8_9BACT|nr:DNA methyltransferase [Aquipluma nitroreducens]BBE18558.1 adenine-specific methyltransferase [Aquipluma nitroreducens]